MTYAEAIDYLYHSLPMYSRIGAAAYKKDLTNTLILCDALGNPHRNFKSIHIAGTNGKGSVSHMLAAVLQTAGYKTGLYTSPHLRDFRERIKVDGGMCKEEFVVAFVEKIKAVSEKIKPSFFEITVAMAFEYFYQQHVDIAVIETGLGGRLDSTNIITPELSVITNIGLDHTAILGDSLEKIAYEKAGIIKKNIPVVIGEAVPETTPVFIAKAAEMHADIVFAQHTQYVSEWSYANHKLGMQVMQTKKNEAFEYELDLTGIYQTKNIITVLESLHQLIIKGWNIPHNNIRHGLANAKKITGLHGRWEVLKNNPTIIADVAHNEDGMKQLVEQLEHCVYNRLHIIIGLSKDKDIQGVLQLLPLYATYYFTQAQIPRALPANELAAIASELKLAGKYFADVNKALDEALLHAHKEDMILICGSVFLAGEVKI